jgi:hypothetical protein
VEDGGRFGTWAQDEDGNPCFDLRPEAVHGDVWHQVGNDRITATAHADGTLSLYWCEQGLVRLTEPPAPGPPLAARWGCGYAEWRHVQDGFTEVRRAWAPFGDLPGLCIDVALAGALSPSYTFECRFAPYPIVLGGLMSRYEPPPRAFSWRERISWRAMLAASALSRRCTEALRAGLGRRMRLHARQAPELRAVLLVSRRGAQRSRRPSWLARLSGTVFVACLGEGNPSVRRVRRGRHTVVSFEVPLASGATRTQLRFVMGVAPVGGVADTIAALRAASRRETASAWRGQLRLDLPAAPALAREAAWHAMYLRSARVRDSVLGSGYVPQGSAYTFVHGLQGAPRDYAISAVALAHFDPEGARQILRLCLRLMKPDGSLHYAHSGAGRPTSAAVHRAPSDLPLFLLWAVTEYAWISGDRDFVAEVRPALQRTWEYLRNGVGLGPHGLLRVGSGDWNDPITAFAPRRLAFRRLGESTFNSAMAAYVLPRAAELLGESAPVMRALATELAEAVAATWCGAWFLRGYDGLGGNIGAEHLFLDANAWCLVARIGSDAQRRTLVETIAARCDDPSPVGPTILDRPHRLRGGLLPPGWDVNGGVWAAIAAFSAWGYALHDSERAWRCLLKQTLAAHARAYPDLWYGIWSGPDSWNSHLGERAGETFVQPATPMREFPVMNSNAHAGPLLALFKVLGVEATTEGVRVDPRAPAAAGAWRLRTPHLDLRGRGR